MKEVWKDVVGYKGLYEVSNMGKIKAIERKSIFNRGHKKVKRIHREKFLKPKLTWDGYYEITLTKKCKRKYIRLHRIALLAFNYTRKKLQTNHKDGNKLNNHINNLEWCTVSENCIHAIKTGLVTIKKGEDVYNSKLTNNQAKRIRKLYKNGNIKQIELSKLYNVGRSVIWRTVNNVSYCDI